MPATAAAKPTSDERSSAAVAGSERAAAAWPTSITRVAAQRVTPDAAAENLRVIEHTARLLAETNVQEALTLEVGLLRLRL